MILGVAFFFFIKVRVPDSYSYSFLSFSILVSYSIGFFISEKDH